MPRWRSQKSLESVLVTGAGGFIGRAVLRAIAAEGYAVWAHLGPPGAAVPPTPSGVSSAYAEIDDPRAILALTENVQAIVHLAGPPSVAGSFHDPLAYARAHCLGTANVLAACGAHRVRRLVYVSSAEVYGRPERNPVTEQAPFAPLSPYAAMKVAAEELVRIYSANDGLDALVLRPFSVIGPPVSPHSVLWTILRQAFTKGVVSVQAPEVIRDYVFVDDVADAIKKCLNININTKFRTYNIGTGVGTSVQELAQTVLRLLAKDPVVRATGTMDRPKVSDIPQLIADTRRAAEELGWRPRVPLTAALQGIIDDYRKSSEGGRGKCAL